MLNRLEKDILEQWRKVCDENQAITQEYLNLKWYHFFNKAKIKDLNLRREAAHQKWMVLFNLLTNHNIFSKNNNDFLEDLEKRG